MDAARVRHLTTEIAIVTVGVFIALSVDSLREWNQDRTLVRDARATLAREIADNKADLDATLSAMGAHKAQIANALSFARDLLTKQASTITQVQLGANLADLTDAGWRSADRTGALAILSVGDPHTATAADLDGFRHQVLGMRGDLIITEQLGQRLSEGYASLLQK